jgi:single-strand DNA-binding protein
MASVNKCILIGNCGGDPEMKSFDSGDTIAKINLAMSESYKNSQGEKIESTIWLPIVFKKKIAEIVEKWVKKGDQLYIEGRITTRTYDDKDGNKKYITEIVATEMKMLNKKKETEDNLTS